jgi:hypothetical protein
MTDVSEKLIMKKVYLLEQLNTSFLIDNHFIYFIGTRFDKFK